MSTQDKNKEIQSLRKLIAEARPWVEELINESIDPEEEVLELNQWLEATREIGGGV